MSTNSSIKKRISFSIIIPCSRTLPLGLTRWPKLTKVNHSFILLKKLFLTFFFLFRCGGSLYQDFFLPLGNGYSWYKSIGALCHQSCRNFRKSPGKFDLFTSNSEEKHNNLSNYYLWQKIENRVSTDEDLKLSDTLRYYMRDTTAAKNLLYRRLRCLADYEAANRALEKARAKNKDVHAVSVLYPIFLLPLIMI